MYLQISNGGEIDSAALSLLGASTKRGNDTKIGQFGSGNKYAIAYLLRNGYNLRVFSGTKEITIHTEECNFRGHIFNVVYINGEKTSITTDMGPKWELWHAIRELYSNAVDEREATIKNVPSFEPKDGETHFYINITEPVQEILDDFTHYFSFGRSLICKTVAGNILPRSGNSPNIYRRGIRCYDTGFSSLYDYDLQDVEINESRTVRFYWDVPKHIWEIICQSTDATVIRNTLNNLYDSELIEGNVSMLPYLLKPELMSSEFKEVVYNTDLAPREAFSFLPPEKQKSYKFIPMKLYDMLKSCYLLNDESKDLFKTSRKGDYKDAKSSALQESVLQKAMQFLIDVGFPITYKTKIVDFKNSDVLGCADEGEIKIARRCLDRGIHDTVCTLIEEHIHLKYEKEDETRGMQDAIIQEFVTYMKEKEGIAL